MIFTKATTAALVIAAVTQCVVAWMASAPPADGAALTWWPQ